MNIVDTIERRDRMAWEKDTDGWRYTSESTRIGWELARLVSAVYGEPEMWEEYKYSHSGLTDLVKLARIYGIPVEIDESWIRFGPGPRRWLVTMVEFTKHGDAFAWKATVEKA
jgi:hypothetical protein